MLELQREWFIRQARRDKVPESDAEQRLAQLDQFLKLLDRAWMTANIDATTLRISAGIAADASAGE
jgi:cell division septal protein FtsQ